MKKILFSVAALAAVCFVACSKDDKKDVTPVEVKKDSIVTFTDVRFSLTEGDTIGRAFSTHYGKMFTDKKIPASADSAKYIDLVSGMFNLGDLFFASPDSLRSVKDLTIAGATHTKVQHVVTDTTVISDFKFDTLTHASTLNAITVADQKNEFDTYGKIKLIFFENAQGKKGVIRYKATASDLNSVRVDIKVQY